MSSASFQTETKSLALERNKLRINKLNNTYGECSSEIKGISCKCFCCNKKYIPSKVEWYYNAVEDELAWITLCPSCGFRSRLNYNSHSPAPYRRQRKIIHSEEKSDKPGIINLMLILLVLAIAFWMIHLGIQQLNYTPVQIDGQSTAYYSDSENTEAYNCNSQWLLIPAKVIA